MLANLCQLACGRSVFITQCDMLAAAFGRYTDLLVVSIIDRSIDFYTAPKISVECGTYDCQVAGTNLTRG